MALYFDCDLDGPKAEAVCLAWQKQNSILAVGSKSSGQGVINLYTQQGDKINDEKPLIERSYPPTNLQWHPATNLLATSWSNGELLMWNQKLEEVFEVPKLHTASVVTLNWTSAGSRLSTGDKEGVFACWKVDSRGKVQHDPAFRVNLNSPITDCVVKHSPSLKNSKYGDIESLAKAAVGGDETALDLFADSSKSSLLGNSFHKKEGLSFYVGTAEGTIFYIDENGKKNKGLTIDSSIQQILFCPDKEFLVAITADLQVVNCEVKSDGSLIEKERVKFSGRERSGHMTWVGDGLLAVATADRAIRLWDLINGDNSSLPLSQTCNFRIEECVTKVDYFEGIIATCTDRNQLAIWKKLPKVQSKTPLEDQWKLQNALKCDVACDLIKWNHKNPVVAVGLSNGAKIFTEELAKSSISSTMVSTQTGPRQISVNFIGHKNIQSNNIGGLGLSPQHISQPVAMSGGYLEFQTDFAFNGISASTENIAVWNGKKVSVFDVSPRSENQIGSFNCDSSLIALHDQSLFSYEKSKGGKDKHSIQVRNFQGTVKQLLNLQENEGKPTLFDVRGNFLVAGTDIGYIRVYDLSRRDAKPHHGTKCLAEVIPDFESIRSLSCNANGTKVAMIVNKRGGKADTKVYVYDLESDRTESFDFNTGTNDIEDIANDSGPKSDLEQSRMEAAKEVAGHFPAQLHWATSENRLLVCETKLTEEYKEEIEELGRNSSASILSGSPPPHVADAMVVSLFSTQDHGLVLQDSFEKAGSYEDLVGLKVPYFYFTKSNAFDEENSQENVELNNKSKFNETYILRKSMRNFADLSDEDTNSISAMLNFSYFLTIGDMDEAFKAIKLIKGIGVWESMAKMCVKTRRLDVAKVCLANMGHARGARALREAEKEPQREAKIARLALELGMNDEAERLYRSCERFDLLNQFYQATGEWGKALETAEFSDRIHLRTTFYKYAKHLEASGDITGAIPNFEQSGTHLFEVPRMLFDEMPMLEAYIMQSPDRKLRKWWAQYMESTGDMETALKFYEQAADPLSLVRVYCYCGNPEKASDVANETGDRAACYHLARQFENNEDIKQAIHFFTRAMAYGNAIRICKEHGFEDQLMNLALLSSPTDMIEAARHYEDRHDTVDKAVMLYHKAGHFSKALELAFESQQFAALEVISQELDERTDPLLLQRCAEYFTEHMQFDRAVAMLVVAKKYSEAISVCNTNDVRLDEELVEKLTPPKEEIGSPQREGLLIKLGDCCMKQGEYHLACKKYTQGGDKEKAMRALLKSGDTEKIIFFAGVSRTRSFYVMAANYLQSLDWRKDPEIMKNIINFYQKGRALDSLAGFYDACAQVEIDEYQNYEKAVGALTEAFKCLTKAKMADKQQQEAKVTELKARIALVKKFIQARRLFESDAEEGLKQCRSLLNEPDLESSVRYGDVYGLLVEYYTAQENYDKAYHYMQELRSRMPNVTLSYFINTRTIENVHRAVGVPLGRGEGLLGNGDAGGKMEGDSDDDVTEELFEAENNFGGPGFGFR